MHVILKLIGHIIDEETGKYFYEIKLNNIEIISYDVMKNLLTSYGLDDDDIHYITITCDCKNIKNYSVIGYNTDKKKIYMYTCKEKIKKQLEEIFTSYGHKIQLQNQVTIMNTNPNINIDTDIIDNDTDIIDKNNVSNLVEHSELDDNSDIDEQPELDFTKINNEAKILFGNNDFVFLLKIYLNKPELFKTFYKYISSGNILINGKENNKEISTEELNINVQIILNLNLGFTQDEIEFALKYTGNHLNLSIRYLLFKKVE